MPHVVLLGDSIFDNAAYVRGGPDVVSQLRVRLGSRWRATLCAVDGASTADVRLQAARIPADATHLVLSVGGNDALDHIGILDDPATSVADVLGLLADIASHFERAYREALAPLRARELPLVACTVYNGSFPDATMQRLAQTALAVFDDVILRVALDLRLDVIEMRAVCREPGDYANPIEPSVQGGARIADAVARAIERPAGDATWVRVLGR